ncbi:MAG: DUF664 domain-containing protein [Phycisphaera sp.]|nr:DUF664 domain-containing protein [Phycisphaera sp.]
MSHTMTEAARLFQFNTKALHARVNDLTPAEWRQQVADSSNALWVVGHVAIYRRTILRNIGLDLPTADWEAAFAKGTKPTNLPDKIGSKHLLDDLAATSERLGEALPGLTDEQLAGPFPRTLPDGSNTLGGAVLFLLWHETYHIGQLGLIRKILGKPTL